MSSSRSALSVMISLVPIGVVAVLAFILVLSESDSQPESCSIASVGQDKYVWNDAKQRWLLFHAGEELSCEKISQREACLWPEDDCAGQDDRIIDQLQLKVQTKTKRNVIKIFPPDAMGRHLIHSDAATQDEENLPDKDCLSAEDRHRCKLTYDLNEADVVVFPNADVWREPTRRRRASQIWIAYLLESPPNTFPERYSRAHRGHHEFNWTASYRRDSDIVTPYAKFVPFDSSQDQSRSETNVGEDYRESIRDKRKKVAWFASNCHTPNGRLEFAKELSKHIQVDIYGKCGSLTCDKWNQSACLEILNRDYKFYLSFENSNSPEYITEKLFQNALGLNAGKAHLLLPIVMGPSRSDYELLAPPDSFIHADDFNGSAEKLADYLKLLDSNDALYYSYFKWKTMGRFVDTKFMCRICLMAHKSMESGKAKIYSNLKGWFRDDARG